MSRPKVGGFYAWHEKPNTLYGYDKPCTFTELARYSEDWENGVEGAVSTLVNGVLHSVDDKPSLVTDEGEQIWHRYGVMHRDGAPARMLPDESWAWYQNGKRHRVDGPASYTSRGYNPTTRRADGTYEYWLEGIRFPKYKWQRLVDQL